MNDLYFFFNDTATTEIYTLSLHDALPISGPDRGAGPAVRHRRAGRRAHPGRPGPHRVRARPVRPPEATGHRREPRLLDGQPAVPGTAAGGPHPGAAPRGPLPLPGGAGPGPGGP